MSYNNGTLFSISQVLNTIIGLPRYIGMNKALIYKTTTNLCCDKDKMKCFKILKNFSQISAMPHNGLKILEDKLI